MNCKEPKFNTEARKQAINTMAQLEEIQREFAVAQMIIEKQQKAIGNIIEELRQGGIHIC